MNGIDPVETGGRPPDAEVVIVYDPSRYMEPETDLGIRDALGLQPGMNGKFAESLETAHSTVHASGLRGFDTVQMGTQNLGRHRAARAFARGYQLLRDPVQFKVKHEGVTRQQAEVEVSCGVRWDAPQSTTWLAGLLREADRGIEGSSGLLTVTRLARFNYAPELGLDHPFSPHPKDRKKVLEVCTAEELEQGIGTNVVVERLRRVYVLDRSKDRLDARVKSAFLLMQHETAALILSKLEDVWTLGGPSRKLAEGLFRRYRSLLLQNNVDAKIVMANQAYEGMEQLVVSGRVQGNEAAALTAVAGRLRCHLSDCQGISEMFLDIYEALGYDAPAGLERAPVPESATEQAPASIGVAEAAGAAVAEVTVEDLDSDTDLDPEVPEPEPDPDVVAGLQTRATDLVKRVAGNNQRWAMKKAAIANAGLEGAIRLLTHPSGLRSVSGEFLHDNMDRDQAIELVSVIRQLGSMTTDQLNTALMYEYELVADVNILHTEIQTKTNGIGTALPAVFRLSKQLAAFGKQWRRYEQIILTIWPPAEARKVADNVRDLLPPAE
jgi:hypothetical protein